MALHRKHDDDEPRDLDINPVYVQVPDHVAAAPAPPAPLLPGGQRSSFAH